MKNGRNLNRLVKEYGKVEDHLIVLIRKHPVETLGAAAGVGLFLGAIGLVTAIQAGLALGLRNRYAIQNFSEYIRDKSNQAHENHKPSAQA